ncbi:unnamed protein product [Rhizophagus irregularis]|uniref:Uncharacterized protein n=1 Tax=Rhizophagus irregularis TaxID=588596 RepID=A0A2I1EFF0_9GLOM|nr:hypothetical protein RhiirB3_434273 [Rhizophagus irregularis]CAB5389316.1 unnamed protein product [Rhizophagus irregularis]
MKKKFSPVVDSIIKLGMSKGDHQPRRFARISKCLPQYNPKQIRNRWREKLDPNLCHDPLSEREKQFIIQWISISKMKQKNDRISWVCLRYDLKTKFYITRPENVLKNYWYSRQRRLGEPAREGPSNKPAIPYLLNY